MIAFLDRLRRGARVELSSINYCIMAWEYQSNRMFQLQKEQLN